MLSVQVLKLSNTIPFKIAVTPPAKLFAASASIANRIILSSEFFGLKFEGVKSTTWQIKIKVPYCAT